MASGQGNSSVFAVPVEGSYQDNSTNPASVVQKTFFGRVRAIDTSGNIGDWTAILKTDPSIPLIDSEYVVSLTASKIKSGTIEAAEIILGGANPAQTLIKSANFDGAYTAGATPSWSKGTAGWMIAANGEAVFGSASIRGSISASSIDLNAHNYWRPQTPGEIPPVTSTYFKVGNNDKYVEWNGSTLTIKGTLSGVDGTFSGTLSSAGGIFSGSLSAASGTFGSYITAGSTQIGKNVRDTADHNGIALDSGSWNNAWVRRGGDGSVYFRAGSSTKYIQIDTQSGATNAIVFPNFSVDNNGSITATSANITGTINSSSGTIGGFTLGGSTLSASTGTNPPYLSEYTSININRNGLIESYYAYSGLFSNFVEHVKINNYAAGGNGAINITGTASGTFSERWYTSYGEYNPSDIRLKNLIEEDVDALSLINNVQTTKFVFKNDETERQHFGFIAQQIYEHIPYVAIPGGEDPQKQPWGIVQANLIPYLVKAIQQLSQKVDELESRLL